MKLSSPIDLIKKSVVVFFEKDNFICFLKIYSLLLPFQIFFYYQNYFVNTQSKILDTVDASAVFLKYPWFLAGTILVNVLFMVVSFWINLAGTKAVIEIVRNKRRPINEFFQFAWKNLWVFSLMSITLGLIIFGGFILLIIPGVIFSVWYGFSKFAFVDSNVGVIASLKSSKRLVSGRFWPVLGRSIVFFIFIVLVQAIFNLIPYGLGSSIVQIFGALAILPYYFLYEELIG